MSLVSTAPFNQEQVEFHGYRLQPVETGGDTYYVMWRGDDVVARGSRDTIMSALRDPLNDVRRHIPRDWEPAGYEDV